MNHRLNEIFNHINKVFLAFLLWDLTAWPFWGCWILTLLLTQNIRITFIEEPK